MASILVRSYWHTEHSNEIREFVVHVSLLNFCLVQGFGLQCCDVLCVDLSIYISLHLLLLLINGP